MSKENKLIIGSIVAVVIMAIGFTYAYFAAIIEGNRKNITINMTDLRIIFNGGDTIEGSNLYSEDNFDVVKTFTIENKTKSGYEYNLVIEDLVNTTATNDSLVYKITCDDSNGYNMDDFKELPKSPVASNVTLAFNIGINKKSIQTYTIEIKYINKTDVDQSADMGAKLSGKIFITKGEAPNLLSSIILDNKIKVDRTDFISSNLEDTSGYVYQTNKTEDGSTVYYFSGKNPNNWVQFGIYGTNDDTNSLWSSGDSMYWRILRTNEDGSVRLIYSGTSPHSANVYIGEVLSNNVSNSESDFEPALNVGYMYGTTDSLATARTNVNDSKIKQLLDMWYVENLLPDDFYSSFISKDAIYCNDRSMKNKQIYTWGSYERLYDANNVTYKCGGDGNGGLIESSQTQLDKFSVSTEGGGNGQLTYPIGLPTADEVVFAGVGSGITDARETWLYDNENQGLSTMTPYYGALVAVLHGGLLREGIYGLVRPVISLDTCAKISNGNGTASSPYVLDTCSCGLCD